MGQLSRRNFLISVPLILAGCAISPPQSQVDVAEPSSWPVPPEMAALYGPVEEKNFSIPAVDLSKINPKYWRQEVAYPTSYPPGTLIVDTPARFLYLIRENGKALRYGIGVGKAGLAFEGEAVIQYKRIWPSWAPTRAMMEREPERYGHLGKGLPPGPDNPLGARALYLFKDNQDTYFRIHGSHEDWSIGRAISSGCIRLLNQDVIDLYGRVPDGTKVVVLQQDDQESTDVAPEATPFAPDSSEPVDTPQNSDSLMQPPTAGFY